MGFELEETHYKLVFEDPQLNGLEATVREISTGELLDLAELVEKVNGAGMSAAPSVRKLFQMVGSGLVEWNMTERGEPVMPTYDALVKYPLRVCLAIANAWVKVMAAVDVPLPNGSSGGETSLEPSIPMEPSSPSRGS